jgi:hypothetical protein
MTGNMIGDFIGNIVAVNIRLGRVRDKGRGMSAIR